MALNRQAVLERAMDLEHVVRNVIDNLVLANPSEEGKQARDLLENAIRKAITDFAGVEGELEPAGKEG